MDQDLATQLREACVSAMRVLSETTPAECRHAFLARLARELSSMLEEMQPRLRRRSDGEARAALQEALSAVERARREHH